MSFLCVQPKSITFKNESECESALKEIDRYSLYVPISSWKELVINPNGLTVIDGYRYNSWSMLQLCSRLCSGLNLLVKDISGVYRTDKDPRSNFSIAKAVNILNDIIQMRFGDRLFGYYLLRDTKNKIIDGILGPKYQLFTNLDAFDQIREASRLVDMKFYEAVLNGRCLSVRYILKDPVVNHTFESSHQNDPERDLFYSGCYFSNNEVGKASVKSAIMLLREFGRTCSLMPTGDNVRHTGKDFQDNVAKAVEAIHKFINFDFAKYISNLKLTSLRLNNKEEREVRIDKLIRSFFSRKLSYTIAKRVIYSAISMGAYDRLGTSHLANIPEATWIRRNMFDLYVAICREAKKLPINLREQLEVLANKLLINTKIEVKDAKASTSIRATQEARTS